MRACWLAYERTNGRGEDNVFNYNETAEWVSKTGCWDTRARMYKYRENGRNETSAVWVWKYWHGKQTTPTSATATTLCFSADLTIYLSIKPRIAVLSSLHHVNKIQLSCSYLQNPVQASPRIPPSLSKLAEWLLFISFHPSYLYEAEISGEHLPDKVDQWLHSVLVQVPPFATLHPPLRTEWNYRRD